MIIRRVRLTNILSHEDTDIEFPDGVISIVGPNGAGKSSIVDSVYVALLSGPTIDVRGGKKEFIVMRGKRRGDISVEFEIGGKIYCVERRLEVDGTTQARLYEVDGEDRRLRAEGVANVVKEVGRLLGLSNYKETELRRLARATVLSLQDELTQIVDIEDSKRKEWILSLLGLSYLEAALESLKSVTKEELSEIRGKLNVMERQISDTKSNLERLRKELDEARAKLRKLLGEKARMDGELVECERRIGEVGEALSALRDLRAVMVLKRISELRETVERFRVLGDWNPDHYVWLVSEVERREREFEEVNGRLERALENAERELGVPVSRLGLCGLEKLGAELDARVSELSERKGAYEERARLYEEMLSRLELGERCPLCGSRITDPGGVRRRVAEEVHRLREELSAVERELSTLEGRRQLVAKRLGSIRELFSERASAERELAAVKTGLESAKRRAEELCRSLGVGFGEVEECVASLRRFREELKAAEVEYGVRLREWAPAGVSLVDPAELKRKMEELAGVLSSALDRLGVKPPQTLSIESLEALARELEELRRRRESEREDLRRKSAELSVEIGRLNGEVGRIEADLESGRARLSQLEKEREDLEKRGKALEVLEKFGKSYMGKDGKVAKSLTRAVRAGLERRANRVLERLGLPPIALNEEFQIAIRVPGGEVPVKNASGGERIGISIALRLALAELVMGRSPTALIVDEPTVYLDRGRRELVFDIIRELGRSLRQLVVVTHDETVVRVSDKVVAVERVGGVSRVSVEQNR